MTIGLLMLKLRIPESQSLKAKRQVLLSFKTRLRSKFNASVCESDDQDKWQAATLAVACVGTDQAGVNGLLSQVAEAAQRERDLEMIDYTLEFF
ncbi:MAG: DUF503 domain-containing protein [Candidatus Omnitrophica bacterium]|nr:DUF503 domain-containing protein [Candidatus Omnitrophota bacterium]